MKRFSFILAAALAAALSCSEQKDTTTVTIKYSGEEIPDSIALSYPAIELDTTLALVDGVCTIELPTDVANCVMLGKGRGRFAFVPDGTDITVNFGGESPEAVSADPENSVQQRLNAFRESELPLMEEQRAFVDSLMALDNLSDEELDSLYEAWSEGYNARFSALCKETIAANADNYVAVAALREICYDTEDSVLAELIAGLSEAVRANSNVQKISNSVNARVATQEGKMFTDFTVEEDAENTFKLSDYVGKGKYVLVDFWASWCGPCRREIPNIAKVYEQYGGEKLDVISIAVWDEVADTENAIAELGINWITVKNAQAIPTDLYGIDGIPHIILFGPDGTILKRNLREEGIINTVAEYLD